MAAIAAYDSGSPDYKLGALSVATFHSEGPGGFRCKMQGAISSALKATKDYILEPGTGWIFYQKKGKKGPFTLSAHVFQDNEVFKYSSYLREKCGQLAAWMEVYTYDDKQGLKQDGAVAALSQTNQSLDRLDNTFQVVINTLKDVFQEDFMADNNYSTVQAFNAIPIETRLDKFQQYVNTHLGDELFEDDLVWRDSKYRRYNDLSAEVAQIGVQYGARLSEFTSVANRDEQRSYLGGFYLNSEV